MPKRQQITVPIGAELRAWLDRRAAKDVGTVASVARRILVEAMRADGPRPLPDVEAIKAIQRIPDEWTDPDPFDGTPQPQG
jgi:hypothetical protein